LKSTPCKVGQNKSILVELILVCRTRVVLFGNGSTAVQIVPAIVSKTKHLTQIIRSKHWILPSVDLAIGPGAQWLLRYIPGANFLLRLTVCLVTETHARAFSMTESGRRFREQWKKVSETYIRKTAPAKYYDLLIPDFEIGCKRRIFDSGYVESLHSENLTLTDDKVFEILPEGVRTEKGLVEADVIILANGFETDPFLSGVELVGRGGKTVTEHWEEFGGPEGYNTTALSGFPNFFMLYGPNSGTGHTSTILAIENVINFSLRVIKPVLDGQASIVNVKRDAEEWYSNGVQEKSKDTVWYSGCVSWYFKTNKNGQKWNAAVNPYSQAQFWFQSLFPTWGHWEYSSQMRHEAQHQRVFPVSDGMILATSAFSDAKSRSKVSQSPGTILPGLPLTPQAVEPLSAAPCAQPRELPSDAYIDRILQSGPQDFLLSHEPFVVKAPDKQVPSSGFAFFSEQRVNSLTERVETPRLRELIENLDNLLVERLIPTGLPFWLARDSNKTKQDIAYFKRVHPIYPFLDRQQFQGQALNPDLDQLLEASPAFSALYHTVLALGSQYCQGGSFEPGVGKAWDLFQVSLGHIADLIVPRESFENLQALTAMCMFATNVCCIQIEDRLVSQAARMAAGLRYHSSSHSEPIHLKTFWVIYAIEKQISFQNRINSIICDDDIGCMITATPESHFGEFNWFLSTIRFGRLLTIAYQSLFSLSASLRSVESYLAAIGHVRHLLEDWRLSIPAEFQPGGSTHFGNILDPNATLVALQTHFSYYHLVIGLERLTLHVDKDEGLRRQESRLRLMNTAKSIISLTQFIELEPHVPLFIMCLVPVSALFILFDFVIHNPNHVETRASLSLLDSAAGYFSLVECASKGAVPAGILSGFSSIAREYFCRVNETRLDTRKQREPAESASNVSIPDQQGTEVIEMQSEAESVFMDNSTESELSGDTRDSPSGSRGEHDRSNYLNYPTPSIHDVAAEAPLLGFGDSKALFGWVFPDCDMGRVEFE
ncbi:hypothetical protein QWA68_016280, partial [Fusarium oxysporum]